MELAVVNSAIVTEDGEYTVRTISPDEARKAVADAESVRSYIGHEATVGLVGDLLEHPLTFHRGLFAHQPGQSALVFKLAGRVPNGVELDRAGLEEVGYTFKLITRTT